MHIYAGDKTGVTTVTGLMKVIAQTGTKVVRTPESGERGQLVTVMAAASAAGHPIPPMYIFPRKKYNDLWVQGGPTGCTGHATSSGWQDKNGFLKFLKHMQSITKCRPGSEILFNGQFLCPPRA